MQVLLIHLPTDSALVKARVGPAAAWSVEAHLLGHVVDLLAGANWQRAGRKSSRAPKPIPRPGDQRSPNHFGSKGFDSPAAFEEAYQRMVNKAEFKEVTVDGS